MYGLFNIKVTSKYFNGILKLIFPNRLHVKVFGLQD